MNKKVISVFFYSLFIFIVSLFTYNDSCAQDCEADTCLIRITSGGSVSFNINSLNKYKEGVDYNQWTRIAIHFSDDVDPTKVWKLEFKSMTAQIEGDSGVDLDLSYISIFAEDGGGITDLSPYIEPEQELTSLYQPLIMGAPQGSFDDNIIILSYKCGKGIDKLLGEPPGYYVVDIELKLSVQ
ncbi:MAG: hypothetical protein R6U11_10990 [Bacteroidales bacterium]